MVLVDISNYTVTTVDGSLLKGFGDGAPDEVVNQLHDDTELARGRNGAQPKAKVSPKPKPKAEGIELTQGNAKPPPKPEDWVARGGEKSARVDLADVYSSRRGSNWRSSRASRS